jgi:hypothetical protein
MCRPVGTVIESAVTPKGLIAKSGRLDTVPETVVDPMIGTGTGFTVLTASPLCVRSPDILLLRALNWVRFLRSNASCPPLRGPGNGYLSLSLDVHLSGIPTRYVCGHRRERRELAGEDLNPILSIRSSSEHCAIQIFGPFGLVQQLGAVEYADRESFGKSCANGSGPSASFGGNAQRTSASMVAICWSAMRLPCGRWCLRTKVDRQEKTITSERLAELP